MEIISIIIAIVFGVVIGAYFGYKYCYNNMIREFTSMITDQIDYLKHEIIDEKHYLYFLDDNVFASQGDSLLIAAKNYSLNFDNHIGHVKETPLKKEFFIVDGAIEYE